MKKENGKPVLATVASSVAKAAVSNAANTRCVFVYHQPKQPKELQKFRRF